MTILHTGPSCFNLLLADTWHAAYLRDPATISLLAEPLLPKELPYRAQSSLLSPRKSGTIGDNKEGAHHDH